jgi:Domain of unknown function (DUF4352)
MCSVKRRSKAVAASATVLIAAIIAAMILLATLQTALTSESTRREQNPAYVEVKPNVHARLNETKTAGNLTFRVTSVMNSNEPEARHVWTIYETDRYAPLNPIQGSKYAIVNVTVANAKNGTSPFRYSDVVLVGSDGKAYYANYAASNANCSASIHDEQLKTGGVCAVYIAFSIPDDAAPAKLVYKASRPPIIVDLV